jgi:glycosyltransferase involved in cell wall biosynthesis
MNVCINGRFLTQKLTGVQRFAYEITKALIRIEPQYNIITTKGWLSKDYPELQNNIVEVGFIQGHVWEQVILPIYLAKIGTPLLINLGSTAPIAYKNNVYTLHDVAVKKFPRSFSFAFRTLYNFLIPLCLRQSKVIITVSEFSKREIIDNYNIVPDKIHVIYNAVSSRLKAINSEKIKDKPYLLAVSSLNPQKNFGRLIEAYQRLENPKFNLHIVGGWNKSFANHIFKDRSKSIGIIFLGRLSDVELVQQYKNAEAFLFPSIYEGFGIPPIEAQSFGCPVIASDIEPLREVLRNSALFFDPYNIEEMIKQINALMENPNLKNRLTKLGMENASRFSWNSSAEKLQKLILSNTKLGE